MTVFLCIFSRMLRLDQNDWSEIRDGFYPLSSNLWVRAYDTADIPGQTRGYSTCLTFYRAALRQLKHKRLKSRTDDYLLGKEWANDFNRFQTYPSYKAQHTWFFFQQRTLLIECFISHRGTLIIWHHRTPIIVTSTSFSLPQKFQSSSKGPPLKQQKILVPPDRQSRLCFWNNSAINSDERMKKATQTKRWSFSSFFPFTLTSPETRYYIPASRV